MTPKYQKMLQEIYGHDTHISIGHEEQPLPDPVTVTIDNEMYIISGTVEIESKGYTSYFEANAQDITIQIPEKIKHTYINHLGDTVDYEENKVVYEMNHGRVLHDDTWLSPKIIKECVRVLESAALSYANDNPDKFTPEDHYFQDDDY